MPPFLSKQRQLSRDDVLKTKSIASTRVHVEHAIYGDAENRIRRIRIRIRQGGADFHCRIDKPNMDSVLPPDKPQGQPILTEQVSN